MKDILAGAEELGKLIAASERFRELETARKEAENDEALQAQVEALNELSRKIAQLQREVKPVEPEEKRRLRDIQEKVTGNPSMQRLARAEADFAQLMNRVNLNIHTALSPREEE